MATETEADRLNRRFAAVDEKRYVEVGVLDEKLRSDAVAEKELARRREKLVIRATADGTFLPTLAKTVSPGFRVLRGYQIGEILHGKPLIVAYARDRDIGKMSVGDDATFRIADRLGSFKATIVSVDGMPGNLKSSALLQPFGGPIPVYYEQSTDGRSFKPVETLYRVTLKVESEDAPDYGRVVHVSVPHREMFFSRVMAYLLSSFRREF